MRHFDEDFETEAIEKCSKALNRLDDRAKIRVIKYLLDKFGLIAQTETAQKEVISQNIQYQQNNLVLAEPKDNNGTQPTTSALLSRFGKSIQMKDVLIKGLTKTEPEVILIVCFINSNFGKDSFTRQSILDTLREHKVMSESRRKSLTLSLNSLTKKLYISSLTDDELILTELGAESSVNILNGNSTTKKRKPRFKKSKSNNTAQEVEVEEFNDDDEQA
jgi:NDP-sugar pyrophosphorylase family protein